jgi:uncharacterized protein YgiM (DUF1202 family)
MGRAVATLSGVLILALMAAGLTEATLALGHRGNITDDTAERPQASPASVMTPDATPKSTPFASPVAEASPSAMSPPTPSLEGTTNAFVHMRASESTSSAILFNLNSGTEVQILAGGNAQWQEVEYDGTSGYVFKTYLDN